jgi:thiamine-phosphate pyrophosphorylase
MRDTFALDLYLVTDRAMCAALGIERVVAEAVAGGVTMVQVRDDATSTPDLVDLARRLVALLAPLAVPLVVNNRLDVALAAGAHGLHVGQSDTPPEEARRCLGPGPILGLSITDPAQIAAVDPRAVDYLGVGPIFATATKADAAPAMGLAGLTTARADGLAVVSALCAARDPRAAALRLGRTIAVAKQGSP